MIVYLDASALVKRYVAEAGSLEVDALIGEAQAIGTAVVSRAEVAAAFARAARGGLVTRAAVAKAMEAFNADWEHLIRLQLGEPLAARAAALAWEHGLRGYDAVHLASALVWRETLGEAVTVATYDQELRRGAQATGLSSWPTEMP
ncbi:MAG: type II toxin-antitoxin system VapC family toxin [Betaproteobacteria bacterium]|nr:type II toxin-antitoxin system VapC family toxin [Betaproteobacteria bacterium]